MTDLYISCLCSAVYLELWHILRILDRLCLFIAYRKLCMAYPRDSSVHIPDPHAPDSVDDP